jgi:hypothetical protein
VWARWARKKWVASTNNFKEGNADDYYLRTAVPVTDEHVLVSVKDLPSNFYKIAIEGEYKTVNRWLILSD